MLRDVPLRAVPSSLTSARRQLRTYWALTRQQLIAFVTEAGFTAPKWQSSEATGFFQPVLTARAPEA
ncbi:hypothetical protein [Streptomyces sp. NPDC014744]|uniref:hypothetical protein n=1 Tax=Streptomyces sp. NPDC014744 TaxID=3364903 RepID=UPI003700D8EE